MSTAATTVEELLELSTLDLFAAYGVPLKRKAVEESAEQQGVMYAGMIGFTGESLRGTLMLAPTLSSLRGPDAPATERGQRDWIGELANQLIGRVKTRLLRFGVEVSITTPLIIRGQYLAPVPMNDKAPRPFVYDASPGEVYVWLDVEMLQGLELTEETTTDVACEGDMIMF